MPFQEKFAEEEREKKIVEALLEKYEIIEKIGEGPIGTVLLGKEKKLNRNVVLKILQANPGENILPADLERYIKHIKKLVNLNIPGLVKYYELIPPADGGDKAGIVMEYVDGINLRDFIREEATTNNHLLRVLKETATSLKTFHKNNILHGNIRPTNIFIDVNGAVKLTDPGLGGFEDINYESPSIMYHHKIDKLTEVQHLGACFVSVILREFAELFQEYSSDPNGLSADELVAEIQRNLKIILIGPFVDLIFEMVNADPYRRPETMSDLLKRTKEILTNSDRKKLSSPLRENRFIYIPTNENIEDELEPTVIREDRTRETQRKKKSKGKVRKLKMEDIEVRRQKYESGAHSFKGRRRTRSRSNLVDLDSLKPNKTNLSAIIAAIASAFLIIGLKNGGISEWIQGNQNSGEQEELQVAVELDNKELKVVAYAIDQSKGFNKVKIYERLKNIDALIEKNKDKPEFNTYMNKKIELIEIASVSNSEFLVHRVLDDIENEIDSI